ncbi:hypothetical protein KR200_011487 [Drosophila serrata]|nr:hypothetical protein KR200_011487 [Drosophila serrata]
MLEIEAPKSTYSSFKQSERKVNPLGKTNKRFLGRTIITAIRHNRREKERTQANCRQKLKDLDDIHERRKSNYFYNQEASRISRRTRSTSRSSSSSRTASRSRSRRRVKKSKKRRSRKRSSSRSSKSPSRSRSRSRSHRKKNKKKTRKHRKSHHKSRRRSSSSSSRERNSSPRVHIPTAVSTPTDVYLEHSKQMALAVAMAYGQVLKANSLKATAEERESSPMSDIVKELMSDGEDENPGPIDVLSISSNDIGDNVLTFDVSSNSASDSDSSTESLDTAASSAGSCIALDQMDNNNSDIEIIECPYDKEKKVPEAVNKKQHVRENPGLDSVDLTGD